MADAVREAVSAAVKESHFELIAKIMDALELESQNPNVLSQWPHALHLLGHIHNKTYADARFLWKRIPQSAKENNLELEAVFKLLQFCWNRHYAGMWQALQAHQWSPALQPVIEAITLKSRSELVDLIGISYSTVSPSKVSSICGLTESEALASCQALGWTYDANTGMLSVLRKPPAAVQLDGFGNLQQLSSYMVHLEA